MALISLAGIATAIDNLNLNETTLKARLLKAICARFPDSRSLDTVTRIDPLELIEELWAPKNPAEVKAKRKNLSSLKSSINKSLKEAIAAGTNPEGIIISRDNVFIIAEEKKNQLLDKLALKGDGSHSLVDTLAALSELLNGLDESADKGEALKILDQLDSARTTLARLAGLSSEDDRATAPAPTDEAEAEEEPVEEFEIDDDTVIEFVEEESPADVGSVGEGAADQVDDAEPLEEDDWDSYEVVEDDLDFLPDDQAAPPEADQTGEDAQLIDDLTEIEEIAEEELEEVEAEEKEALASQGEPLAAEEETDSITDLEEVEEVEEGEIVEEEFATDAAEETRWSDDQEEWDSFEVMDEELDFDLEEESVSQEQTIETIPADEVEGVDGADLEEVEEVGLHDGEGESPFPEEGSAAASHEPEHAPESPAGGSDQQEPEATEEDWDSFEVLDDDLDFPDLELEEAEPTEPSADADELSEVEEIEEDELEEIAVGSDEAAGSGTGNDGQGDEGLAAGYSVSEEAPLLPGDTETATLPDRQGPDHAGAARGQGEAEQPGDEGAEHDKRQTTDQGGPQSSPLPRSMDLSQYIEADEALSNVPEVLQEENDEYVQHILNRFMPRFIKIPAGRYLVGGPKRRPSDRAAVHVTLPEFYIGQLPITNDLFDFFIRETGYQTEAERHGYGLVTSGRLQGGVQAETGRRTLAVGRGVITHQIKGANWRHPEGPGSSLANRGHHPVVQVSRLDALAFAAWAGKRLPSEDEWEAAARGPEGVLFPWGNEERPLANLEAHQEGGTTPVSLFGQQAMSPFGLLDMLGNVFEWTSSTYTSQNGRKLSILKGGAWATTHITSAERRLEPATTWSNTIGFRCAVDT